jgi:predicted transcriptional regulator
MRLNLSQAGHAYARGIAISLILISIAAFVILQWFMHLNNALPKPPVGIHVIATPAKQVADIPKHQALIKSGSVRVYESHAKIELKLPDAILKDDTKQVIESTKVLADDHDQTVTTIVDTETGDTQTLVRREPLSWLAWRDNGSAGMYAGIKNGQPTARLEVKQNLFSVKAVHFGAVATLDHPLNSTLAKPDYFIGVGAEYRW